MLLKQVDNSVIIFLSYIIFVVTVASIYYTKLK